VVMFFVTVRLSLPVILVALAVVGLVGSKLLTIMAVLAGLLWDRFAVVVRSLTMQMREREFVLAARAAGCSNFRILTRDILPNLAAPMVVIATLEMANAILLEAALSFLGLGVKPPDPSWGSMIAEAKDFVFFEPWLINIPGFALFVFVVGINLLGDGLQDLLSAKSRR
jgi:peptide/nickel transport system permease protein